MRRKAKAKPFFSVVIPALNEEKYLPKLLEDLSRQTYANFETLVVDGKSTDKTVSFARSFPKITIINSSKRNAGYQRNIGAGKASGKWLIFFDADIRIPYNFLESIKHRCTTKAVDIFTTWIKVDSKKHSHKTISTVINLSLASSKSLFVPSAYGAMLVCKKTVFRKTGGFDARMCFGEDSEIVRRLVKQGYKYKLFRSPRYFFSLRRFHKEGALNLMQKSAFLNFDLAFNKYSRHSEKVYPMLGGAYYAPEKAQSTQGKFGDYARDVRSTSPGKFSKLIKKILE